MSLQPRHDYNIFISEGDNDGEAPVAPIVQDWTLPPSSPPPPSPSYSIEDHAEPEHVLEHVGADTSEMDNQQPHRILNAYTSEYSSEMDDIPLGQQPRHIPNPYTSEYNSEMDDIPLGQQQIRKTFTSEYNSDLDDTPLGRPRMILDTSEMDDIPLGQLSPSYYRTPRRPTQDNIHGPTPRPPSSPLPQREDPAYISTVRKKSAKHRKANQAAKAAATEQDAILAQASEIARIKEVMHFAVAKGVKIGDVLLYISDPANKEGDRRWKDLFQKRSRIPEILNHWTSSKNSPTARLTVHEWAVSYVTRTVQDEAETVTASGELRGANRQVDKSYVLGFDMRRIYNIFKDKASVTLSLCEAMLTTARQVSTATASRIARKRDITTTMLLQAFGEYSFKNTYAKTVFGLYLYSTGAQRQPITVMSHLGLCQSYNALAGKARVGHMKASIKIEEIDDEEGYVLRTWYILPARYAEYTVLHVSELELLIAHDLSRGVDAASVQPPTIRPIPTRTRADNDRSTSKSAPAVTGARKGGALRQLSESMRDMARKLASTGLYGMMYDNINMQFRVGEQVLGSSNTQENGTCATIFRLWNADLKDMQVADLQQHYHNAGPLEVEDVMLDADERELLQRTLVHTILRIIVTFGGPRFNTFMEELERTQPVTALKIEQHISEIIPLTAFDIDESTIAGNINAMEAVHTELHEPVSSPSFLARVKASGGDLLTLLRWRAIENLRAGQEGGYRGWHWGMWIIGLFHTAMTDMTGKFVTYWGKPSAPPSNPASLSFHNTCLNRTPITITSLPPYRTCRDLAYVSLYARVLHCLLRVSGTEDLDQYVDVFGTWEQLQEHAELIWARYADPDIVEDLRHKSNRSGPAHGDMVYESAILFMRDMLITREFDNAVKCGDSGRIMIVLKVWALALRGCGRNKYAHELLHVIHNVSKIWPKPLVRIFFNNWLLNPTGRTNGFVAIDLVQEHLNFWIKVFYRAHGSNASWEWLSMISPCVDVLRQLATHFKQLLGTNIGTRHQPMDLTNDIPILMDSLQDHEVYVLKLGRTFDEDEKPVPDVIAVGLANLTDDTKAPLAEYNRTFASLQARRRLTPLLGSTPTSTPGLVNACALGDSTAVPPTVLPSNPESQVEHVANLEPPMRGTTTPSEHSDHLHGQASVTLPDEEPSTAGDGSDSDDDASSIASIEQDDAEFMARLAEPDAFVLADELAEGTVEFQIGDHANHLEEFFDGVEDFDGGEDMEDTYEMEASMDMEDNVFW